MAQQSTETDIGVEHHFFDHQLCVLWLFAKGKAQQTQNAVGQANGDAIFRD